MSYGHLESSWPVICSPLVADGTVYAAAGRPMVPGGYVVALDVATGQPRWLKSFVPTAVTNSPRKTASISRTPPKHGLRPTANWRCRATGSSFVPAGLPASPVSSWTAAPARWPSSRRSLTTTWATGGCKVARRRSSQPA